MTFVPPTLLHINLHSWHILPQSYHNNDHNHYMVLLRVDYLVKHHLLINYFLEVVFYMVFYIQLLV